MIQSHTPVANNRPAGLHQRLQKAAVAAALVGALFATSGCLTSEFWNCCLFGKNPTARASASTVPHDPPLPQLTRHAVTMTMTY